MAEADDAHDNPLRGIPILGDIAAMLAGGSTDGLWEGARQTAGQIACGGEAEHNVEPAVRHRLSEIARAAELHVGHVTGLGAVSTRIEPVTRSEWAADALGAIRPLMDRLCERLSSDDRSGADRADRADPIAGLMRMMSPMTVTMTAGMMAGHLAAGAFGSFDLAVPRRRPRVLVVPANITGFADEWSLDADDVMLWAAIREHAAHAVQQVPGVAAELEALLERYVDGFRRSDFSAAGAADLPGLDPAALGSAFDPTLDPAFHPSDADVGEQINSQLRRIFSNPELLLGVSRDDTQVDAAQRLETVLSVITAYVDDVVNQAGPRLIGGFGALTEAVRRRQVASQGTDFADRLLGVRLSAPARERAERFVEGVIERAGREGLARLWERRGALPTPNELAAPGLWLARLDLPSD